VRVKTAAGNKIVTFREGTTDDVIREEILKIKDRFAEQAAAEAEERGSAPLGQLGAGVGRGLEGAGSLFGLAEQGVSYLQDLAGTGSLRKAVAEGIEGFAPETAAQLADVEGTPIFAPTEGTLKAIGSRVEPETGLGEIAGALGEFGSLGVIGKAPLLAKAGYQVAAPAAGSLALEKAGEAAFGEDSTAGTVGAVAGALAGPAALAKALRTAGGASGITGAGASGEVARAAQKLREEGIDITAGQMQKASGGQGSVLGRLEGVSGEVPQSQLRAFSAAYLKRADPGIDADKIRRTGVDRADITGIKDKIGSRLDDIETEFTIDPRVAPENVEIDRIKTKYMSEKPQLDPDDRSIANAINLLEEISGASAGQVGVPMNKRLRDAYVELRDADDKYREIANDLRQSLDDILRKSADTAGKPQVYERYTDALDRYGLIVNAEKALRGKTGSAMRVINPRFLRSEVFTRDRAIKEDTEDLIRAGKLLMANIKEPTLMSAVSRASVPGIVGQVAMPLISATGIPRSQPVQRALRGELPLQRRMAAQERLGAAAGVRPGLLAALTQNR
jgi:hypothetical protein